MKVFIVKKKFILICCFIIITAYFLILSFKSSPVIAVELEENSVISDMRSPSRNCSTIIRTFKAKAQIFMIYYLKYNRKFCIVVASQSPSGGGYENAGTHRLRNFRPVSQDARQR